MVESKEFLIPEQNIGKLKNKFASLAKRAIKINAPAPSLSIGIAINEIVKDSAGNKRVQKFVKVKVTWDNSAAEGWSWNASLQHLPEGNIIRNVSCDELPAQYRNSGPDCDHCGVRRKRLNTYVLHHIDGRYVQLGKDCLQDFLGNSPAAFAEKAEIIGAALSAAEANESLPAIGGASRLWPLDVFLCYVAACIRIHGWVSKAQAREEHSIATATRAFEACLKTAEEPNELMPSPEEESEVQQAIAWAENIAEENADEYLHNLKVIAQSSAVESRTIGYAASILPSYRRFLEKSKPRKESEWVGTVGERQIFTLHINKVIAIDTAYGESFIHVMSDENGNLFVWKTKDALDENKSYTLKGRIKEHKDWRGIKQTVLSHCKLVE